MLSEEYGGQLILETFTDNPYLSKFYQQPEKYGLQLEMSFLIERYQQLTKIFAEPNIFSHFIITDYMLKKCLLFAKINLSKQEFKLYHSFFNLIYKKLPKPDIIFYLHSDTETLLRNIKRRGRDYEQSISKVYLNKIERMYFEYFRQNPENKFVIVDINGVDAATIAQKANAKKLYIGHYSSRYKDLEPLLQEAKSIFEATYLSYEGLTISI